MTLDVLRTVEPKVKPHKDAHTACKWIISASNYVLKCTEDKRIIRRITLLKQLVSEALASDNTNLIKAANHSAATAFILAAVEFVDYMNCETPARRVRYARGMQDRSKKVIQATLGYLFYLRRTLEYDPDDDKWVE